MGNYIPEELIEEIRMSNDIVDVVSEYVKLKKKGKVYAGLCPFHKEKTASFFVVPSGQFFKCFGCQKGGNVFEFIKSVENIDFIEAVRFLAERANIQLPEGDTVEEKEKAKLKKEILEINVEAAKFFRANLFSGKYEKALEYLASRSISDRMIKKFGLGYSPEEWDLLYKYLLEKGYSEAAILKSGLVIQNEKGGYYDRFRGRVIFPIFDLLGNVIGFGGRVIGDGQPKYMNSPETPVYEKGKNLYALNFAKNSGEKKLIVVEGYMDVISLHQNGITNAVASLGTALTENQGRKLKKYAEEIIIAYDADAAGQAATLRGIDILEGIGCNVKILTVPQGKDPDEFIRNNGADGFKKLIDNAVPLLEYKIKMLKSRLRAETTEEKIRFLNEMAEILSKIDNNIEREIYVRKLSREYQLSEESILSEIYKRIKPRTNFKKAVSGSDHAVNTIVARPVDKQENKISYYEKVLIALLCTDNSLYKIIKEKIKPENFTDEKNRHAAEYVFGRLEQNKGIVQAEFLGFVDSDEAGEYSRIMLEECNCEDNVKAIWDIINKIELFKLDKRLEEILNILNEQKEQREGNVEKLKAELRTIIIRKKSLKNS